MTDADRIARLRELADAATPGPWERKAGARTYRILHVHDGETVREVATLGESVQDLRDAAFIAAVRDDAPWLLDALTRLQQERDELKAEIDILAPEVPETVLTPQQEQDAAHVKRLLTDVMDRHGLATKLVQAEATVDRLTAALRACLDFEKETAGYDGLVDCTCVRVSALHEIAYETGNCPHQVARAALAPAGPEEDQQT